MWVKSQGELALPTAKTENEDLVWLSNLSLQLLHLPELPSFLL